MRSQRRTRFLAIEPLEVRRLLATYYVATTGSNGYAGTSGAPWATLQYAADRVAAGDTVIVAPGNYVGFDIRTSGTATNRITFQAQPGATIDGVNTRTNRDGINIENASYITIDGFKLIGTADPATSRAGIRIVGDGFDTGIFSQSVIIQNNFAEKWGYWGIFTAFCDDILIRNNTCTNSAKEHGIYFSNSGDRPIIRNNACYRNGACGIHMNGDIFTGDTSLPKVDGIISGATVDGNKCFSNGVGGPFSAGGGSAINCDGVRESRITNNLLYDNRSTGIALYQIDGGGPAINNTIANNTIINGATSRWCILITEGATGATVFNNILFNLHSTRGAIELSADSTAGLVSDYNLVESRFSHSDSFVDLNQWRSLTGGDSHSSAITLAQMQALFTNYAANDFTLAQGANLAVDHGMSGLTNGSLRSAPALDLLKLPRPTGDAWDMGAYERGGVAFATVSNGKLTVTGTTGKDTITIARSTDFITVTRNGSTIQHPAASVTSFAIFSHDGDDIITLWRTAPRASIDAGSGNDSIQSSDAPDTILAGAGNDRVYGRGGEDYIEGGAGHDVLFGEGGSDRIFGGDGNDTLDGGTSGDRIWGNAGNNRIYGQDGNDAIYARNNAIDTIFAGAGVDRAQLDKSDIRVDLETLLA